jgi:hypothetical protein
MFQISTDHVHKVFDRFISNGRITIQLKQPAVIIFISEVCVFIFKLSALQYFSAILNCLNDLNNCYDTNYQATNQSD